ncbi:MAG: radical SAM protein [Saprospiraceae bacterium]|nr:radical SAM protein [Saprospiraceae bacterium]
MFYKELKILLRKNSLKRTLNILQLLSSYFVSRILKKAIHWGQPMSISIEPTTACNLHCPECPSGLRSFTRPTGNLRFEQFAKFVDPITTRLSSIVFYFQGEPYINNDLFKMIHHVSQRNVYTMSSTNGHFLSVENCIKTIQSGLDRLVISIDGTTQDTYEQYRIGGNLELVIEGTKNLVAAKKEMNSTTPLIVFQFLVVKPNEHQIEDVKKLAKDLEVDHLEFKTAQIYNYHNGSDLIPEAEIFSRYKKQSNGTYSIKNKLLNHCWRMWQGCVITWDGRVVPCCFDKDAQHNLGQISNQTLRDVWRNKSYQDFRSKIILGRKNIDICTNCTEGSLV